MESWRDMCKFDQAMWRAIYRKELERIVFQDTSDRVKIDYDEVRELASSCAFLAFAKHNVEMQKASK